jgi:excisionase family DNA binding protein
MDLPEKAYYRPDEVYNYFGIPKSTFYQRMQEGKIKYILVSGIDRRIPREEVERMKVDPFE